MGARPRWSRHQESCRYNEGVSRVATWRPGPNDPETAARWLFRGGTLTSGGEERPKPSLRKKRLIALGAASYLAAFVGLFVFFPKWGGLTPLLNLPYVVVNMIVTWRRKSFTKVGDGPGESVWVNLTVQDAHGRKTGGDRGWLVHCEGWILFEGERTSFAFTRGEAWTPRYEGHGVFALEDRRRVILTPVGEKPGPTPLKALVAAWNEAPIPAGEAILPPTDLHPQHWVDQHAAWVLGAVVAATFGGFAVAFQAWPIAVLATVARVFCIVCAYDCARRLRAELPRVLRISALPPEAAR